MADKPREAVAYRANGVVIVGSIVHTEAGLGLEVEPVALGTSPDPAELARALTVSFDQSARIVSHPSQGEWKGLFQPFLRAAGVRSYKAFMASARRVGISHAAPVLWLQQQRNLGPRAGFEPVPGEDRQLPDSEPERAAALILQLLG